MEHGLCNYLEFFSAVGGFQPSIDSIALHLSYSHIKNSILLVPSFSFSLNAFSFQYILSLFVFLPHSFPNLIFSFLSVPHLFSIKMSSLPSLPSQLFKCSLLGQFMRNELSSFASNELFLYQGLLTRIGTQPECILSRYVGVQAMQL